MKAKRFLAAVLACSIMCGATTAMGAYQHKGCFTAVAADIVESGKCGENAVWTIDSEGTMTISGEGAVSRPTEWYNAEIRNKVISLVIEDGITELGNQMFKGFENLETVSMPQNMLFISHYKGNNNGDTFYDCPKLNFGTCGPYITWKYDEETNSLFIDGKGTMQDYYYITAGEIMVAPWYHNRDNKIDKIFLSEDVECIGMCAFWGYGVSKRPEITVLNPECDVHWLIQHDQPVDENGNRFKLVSKIYGYENSTAHTFALENDIPFEAIDEPVVSTTTTVITTSATSTTTTSITTTTAANTTTTTTQMPTTTSTTSTTTTQKPTTTTATSTTTAQKQTTTSTTSATTTTKPVTSSTTTVTTQPVEYELGDVNDDGKLNAVDASIVLTYYAMTSTNQNGDFTEAQKKAADLDNNGDVNAVDASYILSYYAYTSTTKEEIMPVEEYMKKK